jgi:phosphate transport system permease protein
LVEQLDLVPEAGERLTALGFLNGKTTLVTGDSRGRVGAWFRVRKPDAAGSDGMELVLAHALEDAGAPVTAFGPSSLTRLLAAGFADGAVRVYNVTTNDLVVSEQGPQQVPVDHLAIAPKENALVALAGPRMWSWELEPRHPEASLSALFRPVWYEGFPEPAHVWQSSGGTDDFEPKLGLWPLVFGTIKATFYSMLFGVPLAILAAIYSSEFLDPRLRVGIKSTVEMMASLPMDSSRTS